MYEKLKQRVLEANLRLKQYGLVVLTWGNVSECDRENGVFAIKPSGVDYATMTAEDIVVCDMNGNVVDGKLRPSVDMPTHLELYKRYTNVNGVVHTHSTYATSFAQAGKAIKAYGTTHADYFYGDVPCTRVLTDEEMRNDYELNTGKVIAECVGEKDFLSVPAILVKSHGVFAVGKDCYKAVENAYVLEEVAKMAYLTETLGNKTEVSKGLLTVHYERKHGKNARYGQK